jgi:hypothetical protein
MLPFAIRLAVLADLALNAIAAVAGPEHIILMPSAIGQFGVLVAAGIIVHELVTTLMRAWKAFWRWRHRRR